MSDPIRRPLVLDSPEFSARAENFANLMNVLEFQERFFRDPSGTAAEEFGLRVSTVTLSRANRFIYALLSDPTFNVWVEDFQARVASTLRSNTGGLPSLAEVREVTPELMQEFIESVQEHLNPVNVDIIRELHPGVVIAGEEANLVAVTIVVVVSYVVAIGAGVMGGDEVLSRKTVQLVIRQLDEQQVSQIAAGRELNT